MFLIRLHLPHCQIVAGRPKDGKGESLVFAAGLNSCGQLGLVTAADDPYIHKLTPVSHSQCKMVLGLHHACAAFA